MNHVANQVRDMTEGMIETLWVETEGMRTRVLAAGAGTPMFLLHGVGPGMDAALNWSSIMPRLAGRFRCYAPDLAGFGETVISEPLPEGPAAWMHLRLRQVGAVMERLDATSPFVIGNSRGGGAILLWMLLKSPERVRGAILMGAAGFTDEESLRSESSRETAIKSFYDRPSIEKMAAIAPLFFHDPAALPMPLEDLVRIRFEQATRPGAEAAYCAMTKGGLPAAPMDRDALSAIDKPIMLIHGAEDQISSPANSLALQRRLPGASLHILPAAGHWSHIDQPTIFSNLVKAFADGAFAVRN